MARLSLYLIGVLKSVTFILSIPILVGRIFLSHSGVTNCEGLFSLPAVILGAFLLLVSLAGLVGDCYRISLWTFLLVMFALIMVVGFVATIKGEGTVVSGRGYQEDRVGWLRKWVAREGNWRCFRCCVMMSLVCEGLQAWIQKFDQFINKKLGEGDGVHCL